MNASIGMKIGTIALALGLGLVPLTGCTGSKKDASTKAPSSIEQVQTKDDAKKSDSKKGTTTDSSKKDSKKSDSKKGTTTDSSKKSDSKKGATTDSTKDSSKTGTKTNSKGN